MPVRILLAANPASGREGRRRRPALARHGAAGRDVEARRGCPLPAPRARPPGRRRRRRVDRRLAAAPPRRGPPARGAPDGHRQRLRPRAGSPLDLEAAPRSPPTRRRRARSTGPRGRRRPRRSSTWPAPAWPPRPPRGRAAQAPPGPPGLLPGALRAGLTAEPLRVRVRADGQRGVRGPRVAGRRRRHRRVRRRHPRSYPPIPPRASSTCRLRPGHARGPGRAARTGCAPGRSWTSRAVRDARGARIELQLARGSRSTPRRVCARLTRGASRCARGHSSWSGPDEAAAIPGPPRWRAGRSRGTPATALRHRREQRPAGTGFAARRSTSPSPDFLRACEAQTRGSHLLRQRGPTC